LTGDDRSCPDVDAFVRLSPLRLLWRHIRCRAERPPGHHGGRRDPGEGVRSGGRLRRLVRELRAMGEPITTQTVQLCKREQKERPSRASRSPCNSASACYLCSDPRVKTRRELMLASRQGVSDGTSSYGGRRGGRFPSARRPAGRARGRPFSSFTSAASSATRCMLSRLEG
jgi:hypothetical protein